MYQEEFILSLQLPRPKIQMGAARHYPEQKSTASPFVATFPATNLLVVIMCVGFCSCLHPTL